MLNQREWRDKLKNTIQRAMTYMMVIEGSHRELARGRLREFRMLICALDRWETR